MRLTVREMISSDCERIVDYFLDADPEYILGMGAFPDKLPERSQWIEKLSRGFQKPFKEKEFYFVIWLLNGEPIGHSNLNEINFGFEARMHLHIWVEKARKKGFGFSFLKQTIPLYFSHFNLQKIICEPYALNPAPIKTLEKVGFQFIKEYQTMPGWINFNQKVKRFELKTDDFMNENSS